MGYISKTGSGLDTVGFIGFDNNSNYFEDRIDVLTQKCREKKEYNIP